MKTCITCKTNKSLDNFYKKHGRDAQYMSYCVACYSNRRQQYYQKQKQKEYELGIRKKSIKRNISIDSTHFSTEKQKRAIYQNEYNKQRSRQDSNFKLVVRLRSRLNKAITDNYKSGSAIKDLGCSVEFLKTYLESKFQPGMAWDNHMQTGWHIDHIIPLSSFDLSDPDQLKQACHYTNLQPLWASDNLKKGGVRG